MTVQSLALASVLLLKQALREAGRQSRLLLLEHPPSHKQKSQLVLVLS